MGFISEKRKLLELQNLIFNTTSKKVEFSKEALTEIATEKCQDLLLEINKCLNVVNTTSSPLAFYNCLDTVIKYAEELIKYEPYIPFTGNSPSESLAKIKKDETVSTYYMITRYMDLFCKSISTKNYLSKEHAYESFFSELHPFYDRFSNHNKYYVDNDCKTRVYDEFSKLQQQEREKRKRANIRAEEKDISAFMNDPIIEQHKIKTNLGIDVDWSDDGFFINNFSKTNNYIFPQSSEDIQIEFINSIIKYSSKETTHLILADESLCYNDYKNLSALQFPILSDTNKIFTIIAWLKNEMQLRYNLFEKFRCKSLYSYNNLVQQNLDYIHEHSALVNDNGEFVQPVITVNGNPVAKEKMPNLIFIIHEYFGLHTISDLDSTLIPLLLNSKRAGIHIFIFSKFSQKNLQLGAKSDLLEVGSEEDIKNFFMKNYSFSKSNSIEEIENNMNGIQFEQFCADLLHKNGFSKINVTPSSGDFGADITAYKDGVKYAIQCKRYSSPIGVTAVQEVIASKSMYNCHVAVVLTNNTFTNGATALAQKNGVLLWDRNRLKEMMDKS